jgi:antirestriction protein
MTQEELNDINKLLENCRGLDAEIKEMDRCKEFLINEYKTNKRWFKMEPGKVTIEDVIKASFEFGWSSRRNFDYDRERKATAS